MKRFSTVLWVVCVIGMSAPSNAQDLITNGDFLANASSFVDPPCYFGVWQPLNPASAPGWSVASTGSGIEYVPYNSTFGPTDKTGVDAFYFIQSASNSVQTLTGLTPARQYRVDLKAAASTFGATNMGVEVGDNNGAYGKIDFAGSTAAFESKSFNFSVPGTISGSPYIKLYNSDTGSTYIADFSQVSLNAETLSRGQKLIVNHGLQIQALSFPGITAAGRNTGTDVFNPTRWAESNFTAMHIWARTYGDEFPVNYIPAAPGIPWGMTDYTAYVGDPILFGNIETTAYPYASTLVSYQFGDEQDITDPTEMTNLKNAMALFHVNQPNAITYTNQANGQVTTAAMQNYMREVQPDMVSMDFYPFNGNVIGGSPTVYYSELNRYRNLGLAGNDGTGTQSIPVGQYLQTFTNSATVNNHVVSGSEIRLNQFSSWAFGDKFLGSFLYERPLFDTSLTPILFSDADNGTTSPTDQFYQLAETNRQSVNLGQSLVRLVTTDVRMKMGQHGSGTANDLPATISAWSSGAVPYMTAITATNLGSKNNSLAGDVIAGVFKPLDAPYTNAGHENDPYFMIVNGLSDGTGTAADCQQNIHLGFDFGASGITSLLRRSRNTGLAENVDLVHGSGSQYSLDFHIDGGTGDLFKYNDGGLFVSEAGTSYWTGGTSGTWSTAGNWSGGTTPNLQESLVVFDSSATGNLATTDDITIPGVAIQTLAGIKVVNPSGDVSIAAGGAVTGIQLGYLGVDMSAATHDLTITAPLYLAPSVSGDYVPCTVASGRTLTTQQVHGYNNTQSSSTAQPLRKLGTGTLVLGTASDSTDNDYLKLDVRAGTVLLHKASTSSVHAVRNIVGIDAGALVQYTGTGVYQVADGGTITLTGGMLDLNGSSQVGTALVVNTAGSTLANGYAGSSSSYSPTGVTLNTDLNVNTVGNISLNGPISGAGGLTKTGSGSLTLIGANTSDGGIAVNAGTVLLSTSSTSSVHAAHSIVGVDSGALVQYAGTGDYQVDNHGTITLTGGALDLNGSNQVGTTLVVNTVGSTLANGYAGSSSRYSPTSVTLNGGLAVHTVGNLALGNGPVSGAGWLAKTGDGLLTLSGTNTYTGATDVYAGTLQIGDGGTTGTLGTGSVADNAALVFNRSNAYTVSNAISGSGTLTQSGSGALILSGTNSYSGGTTVNAGTLKFNSASALPSTGTTMINSGGALLASGAYTSAGSWLSSGKINTASTGALALTASSSLAISMGSYTNLSLGASGNYTYSGTMTPAGTTYRFGGGGGTLTVSKALSGSRSMVVAGNVTLSGTNTYTGGTTVNAGNLAFTKTGAIPSTGTTMINSGGAVLVSGAYTTAQNWLNSGKINTASTGALAFTAANSGAINMGSYTNLSIGANGAYTYSGTLTPAGSTYRFGGGGGTLTVSPVLSGGNGLVTSGNVTLTGANTYTGATTVNAGTLRLSGSGAINSSSGVTLNGGTLLQNSSTAFDRPLYVSSGTFGGTGTFSGNLSMGPCHLAPGDGGIGTLTTAGNVSLEASSVLDYDFGTTVGSCDQVVLSGASRTLILDGTINIACSGTLLGGQYTIFSGATNITDNGLLFDNVPAGHGYSYAINGGSVIVTATPEPGAMVLLATGLIGLLGYAWRKGR